MPASSTPTTEEFGPKTKRETLALQKEGKDGKDGKIAKRATKQRAPARPYKKLYQSVLVDRIATMQKQLHVMACKTELLKHRLTNYEREHQQRDEEGYTEPGP